VCVECFRKSLCTLLRLPRPRCTSNCNFKFQVVIMIENSTEP
jgi:hypothetical protein